MEGLIKFFIGAEPVIYIVAGLVLVIAIIRFVKLTNERKKTVFGLEREVLLKRIRSTFTMATISGVMILAELFFVSYGSVKFPDLSIDATPTAEAQISSTQTNLLVVNQPVTQITKSATDSNSDGCVNGQIQWTKPKAGDSIQGSVDLQGTVNLPSLGFYKFEYKGLNDANWITIAGASIPVIDGPFGATWNSQNVTPGDYQLQIIAYDTNNNEYPACIITVHVLAP